MLKRSERTANYRTIAMRAAKRLLGQLDRGDQSLTAGSFDREHWAWKLRDFPLAMLQIGLLPMVELLTSKWPGNQFYQSEPLREWTCAALQNTLRRQHRNGAFDSVGPFTQDHGTTLAMVNAIATALARMGENSLPRDLAAAARDSVRRACSFAWDSSEDYAFISNHQALFALAWLRAAELLGDEALHQRADQTIGGILTRQSHEGWYLEYGGADPGYETLGISYLAEVLALRPDAALRESLRRSVDFLSYLVHPDGSIGGVYGSRFTSLWYPSGLEQLGVDDPVADRVASFVAQHLDEGQVVTPETVDANNLPLLVWSYLRAAEHCDCAPGDSPPVDARGRGGLPCDSLLGTRLFADSGLVMAGTPHYYCIFNGRSGGVGVAYSRIARRLVYRDAGYVVRTGRVTWTSALPPRGQTKLEEDAAGCRVQSPFGEALKITLTPVSFVILRLLNLTVFRSAWLAGLATRTIVGRLVTRRRAAPLALHRHIQFETNRILFRDSIRMDRPAAVDRLVRSRAFQPIHMGSANYYSPGELQAPPSFEDAQATQTLSARGEVSFSFAVAFDDGHRVVLEPVTAERSSNE